MLRILLGVFVILHGLVHLLYFGHSAGYFELQSGLAWPEGAWAFSRLLGNGTTRSLAGISLVLAAAGFVVSSVGIFARQGWGRPALAGAALFSALIFILFWDGGLGRLADKGLFAILINAALVGVALLAKGLDF